MPHLIAPGSQHDRDAQEGERLRIPCHLAIELSALRDLRPVLDTALRHCLDLTDSRFEFIRPNTLDSQPRMHIV